MSPNQVRRSSQIVVGCVGVIGIGLLILVAALWLLRRSEGQSLTSPVELAAATARWEQAGPASYDITVRTSGRRAAVYHVEVREGVAQAAWLDGQPIQQRRLYSVWSVPGMFSTLQREFELASAAGGSRAGAPQEMRMYCQWNATYGYPESYRRLAIGGENIGWDVLEFVALGQNSNE